MPGPVSYGFQGVFQRFCMIFDHFCSFFIAAGNHPTCNSGLCTIMHKCNKKTSKIGTPFYKGHLDFCERVRPMALIISAPRVGPAHNNLNKRYKTGFRFWCFLLQILLRSYMTMHSIVLLCVSGWGDFRQRRKSAQKPYRTRISALRTSWELIYGAFES